MISKINLPNLFWFIACLFSILCVILIIYADVCKFDFTNFDDNTYITENSLVNNGLTFEQIKKTFGFSQNGTYWHPLTWVSHMLDCHMFGLNAGMHHLTNLIFHILNASLLFIIFQTMTGAMWRSAFVATIFAVHPLNVESVAWIAERKNVLSTFFWMLTMLSYLYYSRKPCIGRYLLLLAPFTLGLLAKPMLVTLPCVLLLMDYWPLGRLRLFSFKIVPANLNPKYQPATLIQLILEKVPLLVLSFFSIGMSMLSLQHGNQTISSLKVPMILRLENMAVSYVKYILKLLWPRDLAIFYPFPDMIPLWQVFGAILILLVITATAFLLFKKIPFLIIGWLWFLGALFPVIGLVQGGRWPEMADRWAYVPAIGIFIIISWGGTALLSKLPRSRLISFVIVMAVIAGLMTVARDQISYWRKSESLFAHALLTTKNNYIAHAYLGLALASQGRIDDAILHYNKSLALKDEDEVYNNLGSALYEKGKPDEAVRYFKTALTMNPQNIMALNNIGNAYAATGKFQAAIDFFQKALNIESDNIKVRNNLGIACIGIGQYDEAIFHFRRILDRDPTHLEANINIGVALTRMNRIDEAIAHYEVALQASPENAECHNNLGILWMLNNDISKAEQHFKKALMIRPDYASARSNLMKCK